MYSPTLSQRDEAVGMRPPPPGITPNFTNPPSRAHVIITVHIVLMIISTLVMGLRFYTARFILRHVRAEDYTIFVAWFLALVYSILSMMNTQYGLGRHLWDVPVAVFSPNFFKFSAMIGTFLGISIMLTKLSILMLFLRFVPRGYLRVVIYIIMTIVAVYSLVTSFVWVYACQPLEKFWDVTITGGSCINWLKITVFNGVMNTTTDAAVLLLPFLLLRNVRLPKRQKIGVMIVLMTGGFVLVVSIVRLKISVDLVSSVDITWDGVPMAVWWPIETHIAIVCACLPAGKPLLRKYMPNVIGSSYGSSTRTKRPTIRSIHTQYLPSTDPSEDSQGITLDDNINRKGPIIACITTIDVATEQAAQAE